MKKLVLLFLILLVGYVGLSFSEKYLGVSIRPYGAPVYCDVSPNIDNVLKCIKLNYMKFDSYMSGWNNDISNTYLNSRINRLYQDTNMEFSDFFNAKACSDRNDCQVKFNEIQYKIDSYNNLVGYVRQQANAQGYTYNRQGSEWSNLPTQKLWKFSRSYKFPYHDIVIGQQNGKVIFYILSMEAVPLKGNYDLLIGSVTAFCSAAEDKNSKKYICGGYRFYFYDKIQADAKHFSLSLDKRENPTYALIRYGQGNYKIKLNDKYQ